MHLTEPVSVVLDIERSGVWVRVSAEIHPPEPEVGLPLPQVVILGAKADGRDVALTTDEVRALAERFERAYISRRKNGIHQAG